MAEKAKQQGGTTEQHREAGRRSGGNEGNPEQHREAGRQSHKNDSDSKK